MLEFGDSNSILATAMLVAAAAVAVAVAAVAAVVVLMVRRYIPITDGGVCVFFLSDHPLTSLCKTESLLSGREGCPKTTVGRGCAVEAGCSKARKERPCG
jgi:hypothetical protein